jgi:hypothetical protein
MSLVGKEGNQQQGDDYQQLGAVWTEAALDHALEQNNKIWIFWRQTPIVLWAISLPATIKFWINFVKFGIKAHILI